MSTKRSMGYRGIVWTVSVLTFLASASSAFADEIEIGRYIVLSPIDGGDHGWPAVPGGTDSPGIPDLITEWLIGIIIQADGLVSSLIGFF